VLGDGHTTDAVPRSWLSDRCAREWVRFKKRDVRGLIPWTSLQFINVRDSGSSIGEFR
jgi:hypothetical protein